MRPAPSAGAVSVSLVSSSTRSRTVPPRPRSLNATEVSSTSGIRHATDDRRRAPIGRRRRIETTPRAQAGVDEQPGEQQADEQQQQHQQAEVARHALLDRERLQRLAEGVLRERPGADQAAGDRRQPAARAGCAAAAGRSSSQSADADERRQQRAARLGQQDRQHGAAERRIGDARAAAASRCAGCRARARPAPAAPRSSRARSSTRTAGRGGSTAPSRRASPGQTREASP